MVHVPLTPHHQGLNAWSSVRKSFIQMQWCVYLYFSEGQAWSGSDWIRTRFGVAKVTLFAWRIGRAEYEY